MKNEIKSNNSNTYFLSLFFHLKNLYFVRNHIWKNLVYTVAFLLHFFRVEGYWDCSNKKINTLIEWIGLVDIFFRPSIFGNRLGILTEILVAMDNYLFFGKAPSIQKNTKPFAQELFGSPHTSNRIYLLQNCLSNYVYLKHMYIVLRGICIGVKKISVNF